MSFRLQTVDPPQIDVTPPRQQTPAQTVDEEQCPAWVLRKQGLVLLSQAVIVMLSLRSAPLEAVARQCLVPTSTSSLPQILAQPLIAPLQ